MECHPAQQDMLYYYTTKSVIAELHSDFCSPPLGKKSKRIQPEVCKSIQLFVIAGIGKKTRGKEYQR